MEYKPIDGYVATFFPYETIPDLLGDQLSKEGAISTCQQIVERRVPYTINGTIIGRVIHATYGENGVTIFIELNSDGREFLANPS